MAKGSHSNSILTGKAKYCYVTGRTEGLDKHHIYHGTGLRDISDKHGFWVYLWQPLHLAGMGGLHKFPNKGLDLELKQACQRRFEETRIVQSTQPPAKAAAQAREEFMEIIGKNYLDSEEEWEAPAEKDKGADGFFLLEDFWEDEEC